MKITVKHPMKLRDLSREVILGIFLVLIGAACQPTPAPSPLQNETAKEIAKPETRSLNQDGNATKTPGGLRMEPSLSSQPPIRRILPESKIVAPDKNLASRKIVYDTQLTSRVAVHPDRANWQYRRNGQGSIVGFEFSNHGGNKILPPRRDASKNQFFGRDFQFRFDERARQDIFLLVTDWAPSRDRQFRLSELMNSLIHFFPRNLLPAIVNYGERDILTLPTGEEVEFNAQTHEILAGVLREKPVDLNPDRNTRNFPGIDYTGKGIMVRANSRGTDPRIGTTAVVVNGSPASSCAKSSGCNECQVASKELWEQSGAVRFRFPTDQEFDQFLTKRCGFGLPNAATFASSLPAK
jgi:hypothetical protein